MLRMCFQQLAESLEAFGKPFGVIEPVNADDMRPHDGSAIEPLDLRVSLVCLGCGSKVFDIDTDRKLLGNDRSPESFNPPVVINLGAGMSRCEAAEIAGIVRRLETDDVELKEGLDEPIMGRDGFDQLRRREGNMKEKTNPLTGSERAELRGERHQVIIMHPDEVVAPEKRS